MTALPITIRLPRIPLRLAVARLDPDANIPDWVDGSFVSVTRTVDELSVVCDEDVVPEDVRAERGWTCLEVKGPLDFSEVGVLASLTTPLADVGISIFVISTFDTDYLLLKATKMALAVDSLRQSGFVVEDGSHAALF